MQDDELKYTLKRLVEGLGATREAARPGFSLALAQVSVSLCGPLPTAARPWGPALLVVKRLEGSRLAVLHGGGRKALAASTHRETVQF